MTHLRKAEWDVRHIDAHATAARLIRAWHYSGSVANTSTYRHGLFPSGEFLTGDPYGVALWIPPTRTAAATLTQNWQGVLSLSRLVVDPMIGTNGASFLLGRSMRLIDRERWPVLVTYADTSHGHTGAIYKATNWTSLGEVPAGDTWEDERGRQCGRKRGGRTFTAGEMVERGFVRRPAAPKIKFVHFTAPGQTPPPTAPGRAALSPLPWSAGDEPAGDHTLPGGSTPPNTHN